MEADTSCHPLQAVGEDVDGVDDGLAVGGARRASPPGVDSRLGRAAGDAVVEDVADG